MSLCLKWWFLLFIFFSGCKSPEQDKEKLVEFIKKEIQIINNDSGYSKVVLNGQDFMENLTDGGGELQGYFKGSEIKKIHQEAGFSYGIEITDFYFHRGQLIFVSETIDSFIYVDSLSGFDFTKTEKSFEGRYYFRNRKLISRITSGNNRFRDDAYDPEKILIKESEENIKLLKPGK